MLSINKRGEGAKRGRGGGRFYTVTDHGLNVPGAADSIFCVRKSWQAIRIFSAVAGESKRNTGSRPWSARAAATASLRAKSTEAARNRGGSPTALDEKTALGLGAPRSRDTLNSRGISWKPGIL